MSLAASISMCWRCPGRRLFARPRKSARKNALKRAPDRAPDQQCDGRPFSFVMHELWPQYERGFPSFCQVPAPRLDRAIVGSMLDLMPSPRLIFHEWDRHGTCSGLSAQAYFETVRKARAVVKIPADYLEPDKPITVTPDDVAEAFVKANAGLSRASVAVGCDSKRLNEVRVCLGKDFSFHDCAEVARRTCRRDRIAMPAVRGG
jgi:ribonuclease T2